MKNSSVWEQATAKNRFLLHKYYFPPTADGLPIWFSAMKQLKQNKNGSWEKYCYMSLEMFWGNIILFNALQRQWEKLF